MDSSVAEIVGAALGLSAPWLSSNTHEIMMSLIATRGVFHSADDFARRIGARNRHQIAYYLRKDGLPPLERLSAWVRIMYWMVEYEVSGATICESSLNEGRDPAHEYRLVMRVTGRSWRSVRQLGLVWLVDEFLSACHPPVAAAGTHEPAEQSA